MILNKDQVKVIARILTKFMEALAEEKMILFPGETGLRDGASLGPGNGETWATHVYVSREYACATVWLPNTMYRLSSSVNVQLEVRVEKNEKPCLWGSGEKICEI